MDARPASMKQNAGSRETFGKAQKTDAWKQYKSLYLSNILSKMLMLMKIKHPKIKQTTAVVSPSGESVSSSASSGFSELSSSFSSCTSVNGFEYFS